jgi:hypothetical protein
MLAFGPNNDAVKLLFFDEAPPAEVIDGLDLFNISEIRRPKGGGMEMKFFGRMEAMQRLEAMDGCTAGSDSAKAFYEAIGKSVDGGS